MTEVAQASDAVDSESIIAGVITEPKLWAGKYKTVEDLEEAYKNSRRAYTENADLKKQLEVYTNIPDDYELPSDMTLRQDEIKEIKSIAKNAGLTQSHFEKMAKEMESKIKANVDSFEKAKQEAGEDTINVLNDYVTRFYPEKLHETVINKLIKDKDAMSDALKHRDQILNSKVPGLSQGSTAMPQVYDGQKEVEKAALEYRKQPTEKNRERYINLAREVGNERFKK